MIKLPKKPANAVLRGADWNQLVELLNSALQIKSGPGIVVQYTTGGTYLSLLKLPNDTIRPGDSRGGEPGTGTAATSFFAKIFGWTAIAGCNQWIYTYKRVKKDMTNHNPGAWSYVTVTDSRRSVCSTPRIFSPSR